MILQIPEWAQPILARILMRGIQRPLCGGSETQPGLPRQGSQALFAVTTQRLPLSLDLDSDHRLTLCVRIFRQPPAALAPVHSAISTDGPRLRSAALRSSGEMIW